MRKYLLYSIALFFAIQFVGCNDANYETINDSIYLANAAGNEISSIHVISEDGATLMFTVRKTRPAVSDISVNIEVDEYFLEQYNQRYGTDYKMLPKEVYSMESENVIIAQGNAASAVIPIQIKPFTEEMDKTGYTYALPIVIKSVEGNAVSILEPSSKYVFAFAGIPYADVPEFKRRNPMILNLKNDLVLNTWSYEMLFNISSLGVNIGQMNNQILLNTGDMFVRFGDTKIRGNMLQIKTLGTEFTNSDDFIFKPHKWYHIAIVNDGTTIKLYIDGVENAHISAPKGKSVTNKAGDGSFFCGENLNDSYMKSSILGSEIRIWSIPRSADQIKNNMYSVDPTTQGLEAYWRLNEGEGAQFLDATSHNEPAYAGENGISTVWYKHQKVQVGQEAE